MVLRFPATLKVKVLDVPCEDDDSCRWSKVVEVVPARFIQEGKSMQYNKARNSRVELIELPLH